MAEELKTPYFLIHRDRLEENFRRMKAALEEAWGNCAIGYSYKTNALDWVIRYFREAGCFAEVVSGDEYALAKSIGAEKIIYNGIAKSRESFQEAVREGQIVNIDAEYEIGWLEEMPGNGWEVGVRVNFDLEAKCPGQTQCGEDGERFGFCFENGELKRAIDRIRAGGNKVAGLHLHKSSKTRMPDIYRAIAETAVEVSEAYGLDLKYVDIGGGFFGGLENKPQYGEYFGMVAEILGRRFRPEETMLVVEPGMALIGHTVDYVTTVLDVKKTTRAVFPVTDGSRIHIDPLMTKSGYCWEAEYAGDGERPAVDRQIVSGFTCMEHDRLFEIRNGKALRPGDKIIYHRVGAYTMCLSPLFIRWYPDVYVKAGDFLEKVREQWGTAEYTGRGVESR